MSGQRTILVVEDQEDNRTILRDLLNHAGFDVLEAVTGEEGVRAAEAHRPDLILMDIQLPLVDGYEATRRIKARAGAPRNPDRRRDLLRPQWRRGEGPGRRLRWLHHQALQPAAAPRDGAELPPGRRRRVRPPCATRL